MKLKMENKEVKKKKLGIGIKILIGVVVVIVLLFIFTARKVAILYDLNNKIGEIAQNKTNVYSKIVMPKKESDEYSSVIENYFKDDKIKTVVKRDYSDDKEDDITLTQFIYPEKKTTFITQGKEKKYYEDKEKVTVDKFANYAYCGSGVDLIKNAFLATITSEKVDEKDCYVISSLWNSNVIYEDGTEKLDIYIEKETGLAVKTVARVKGEEIVKTYEYKFDEVTDKDMKEPDSSKYEKENTKK